MQIEHSEILELSPLGVVICDDEQRIIWINERFLADSGLDSTTLIGQYYAALPLEAIDKNSQLAQQFDNSNQKAKRYHYWQAENNSGQSVHYFVLERKQALKHSKIPASKLPKRPNWVEFLDYEVSRSRRYDNPLCVLKLHVLVDKNPQEIDNKTIDQIIKDTLMDELRWADMIGNTSRGSYLMVLPETPDSALTQLINKISKAVTTQLKLASAEIESRVVFGSSYWQKHDDSQKLLKRARKRLVENLEKHS